jgi:AbrB family looped-hinge helix DNA binding protein
MGAVTVSKKYQVVIPKIVREEARIKPGDKMSVIVKHGIIHYVPISPIGSTKGMVPRLDTRNLRDEYYRP